MRRPEGWEVAPNPAPPFRVRELTLPGAGTGASGGRRSAALGSRGATVRALARSEGGHGLHVPGTVVAAAERGARLGGPGEIVALRGEDLRGALRRGTESNLVLFLVDASGSMAARDRLAAVTGAVSSLLRDAYQRRDKVAVVTFRGAGADVVLPPTRSTDVAARRLDDLRTGGRTPLAEGLVEATRLLERERRREPDRRALLVVLSDGRATGRDGPARARAAADALRRRELAGAVVVDCERGRVRLGLAADLARHLGGPCVRVDELNADAVAGVVHAGL